MADDLDYSELESRHDAVNNHQVDESPSRDDDIEIAVDESEMLLLQPEVDGRDGDRAPAGRTEAGASSPFECPVCCRSFNAEFRHPMTLLCGHSTCRSVRQVKERLHATWGYGVCPGITQPGITQAITYGCCKFLIPTGSALRD